MIRWSLLFVLFGVAACSEAPEWDEMLECPASQGLPMGAGESRSSENKEEESPDSRAFHITQVRGLYRPVSHQGRIVFQQQDGYTGEDDLGRVYFDHDFRGHWTGGQSSLEMTVRVPPKTWRHRSTRHVKCVLERRTGQELFHDVEEVSGAEVVDNTSTCTLEFPSNGMGGDSIRVRAELSRGRGAPPSTTHTGGMTLWKRVRVEYKRMASAHPLPVETVGESYTKAYVQFDFSQEQLLVGEEDIRYFETPNELPKIRGEQHLYFERNFQHAHDPGWLCLLAAQHETLESSRAASTFDERQDMREIEASLNADGSEITAAKEEWLDGAKFIEITWDAEHDVSDSPTAKLYFEVGKKVVNADSTKVTYQLKPHDITPLFLAQDSSGMFGTTQWAYSSKREYFLNSRELPDQIHSHSGGYAPMDGMRRIRLTNKFATSGFTMTVVDEGKRYFTGRIIILTHNRAFSDQVDGQFVPREGSSELLKTTVVHEQNLTKFLKLRHPVG